MFKSVTAFLVIAAVFSACRKRAPENIPEPKAGAEFSAEASTGSAKSVGLLEIPGKYARVSVTRMEKVKAAKVIYEKNAREEFAVPDSGGVGGK